jgi:hypothetical protein
MNKKLIIGIVLMLLLAGSVFAAKKFSESQMKAAGDWGCNDKLYISNDTKLIP